MSSEDDCQSVTALVDEHWRGAASLARLSGLPVARVRACLETGVARNEFETPRGVYHDQLWRRRAISRT
jgi:hypothetical protein